MFKLSDIKEDYRIETSGVQLDDVVEGEYRDLRDQAQQYWDALYAIRDKARRNRKFYAGQQWSDVVTDPITNEKITEEELILQQGRQPLKNNIVQQLVKNLIGQYRDNDYMPVVLSRKRETQSSTEMMTNALQYVYSTEELTELDVRAFEKFLLSGIPIWKTDYGWKPSLNKDDVVVYTPNINKIFFNSDIEDIRMRDLDFIGEIIDADLEEVVSTFGETPEQERKIREWLQTGSDNVSYDDEFGPGEFNGMDFFYSEVDNRVRIYEIWKKKYIERVFYHDLLEADYNDAARLLEANGRYETTLDEQIEFINQINEQRVLEYTQYGIEPEEIPMVEYEIKREQIWCYYFIDHHGHLLSKGENPYWHEETPYTVRPHPMVDREVLSFVDQIIDQQKYINRLIIMMDFMLGAGAKGVLMVPKSAIPEGMSEEEFGDKWVKFNSMIVYDADSLKQGQKIEQIYSQSHSVAGEKMLGLQMQLAKELSGITEAAQGQKPTSGTPASLYAQMANNAAISVKDLFEHFFKARRERDKKIVKLIQQYWDDERYIKVDGSMDDSEDYIYDPQRAQDAEYDVNIAKSGNSPIYRAIMDEYLMKFLEGGIIDYEIFLKNTSLPHADKILQQINEKKFDQMGQLDPQTQEIANKIIQR